jgi:hypothetical protein
MARFNPAKPHETLEPLINDFFKEASSRSDRSDDDPSSKPVMYSTVQTGFHSQIL